MLNDRRLYTRRIIVTTDGVYKKEDQNTFGHPETTLCRVRKVCVGARRGRWRVIRIEGQDWVDGDVEMGMDPSADCHKGMR